ncbi:PAS domain-containing sensor histidine kinase [Bradyrhizobium japonicum]|uniref:PAS domain-containing sensor histidine kinase n=1 Tax=Bradyrhizobium japonicum TaxID=375 RepID=UPI0020A114AC|nr:PAS domain-containing sensor histidine kinase [Bradyrhizobium japonicum]MCP1765210.1 PAS domain S-box-containing protein [Bradyrhizobium japonicum]MCP1787348.1 PAS domain S-box-containing protein [Bradyrhizobium japonicum]MCP1809224.1 PAS domain S-box-containing protein [Bradyrhizobium japonicum]MCP1818157.1 PAS domain S-box-containing protein [Bradyrhizobium japonicum]MCP1870333.1 PAS domain S-box-containing protein [Bradyrhizobium japonicum]
MTTKSSQQRDLFESERSFRLLVEGVADYALYMLDPTGIITSWNIGGERIKGYSPEEILGQHFSRFYTETDRANGKPARALGIARDHGRYEEEGWRVRKDGTFFWASVIIDPIYEHGALVGFAKITRDITERRNSQLKLEAMQRQLAESQKFDALGQLTGGVAHDFNNLLMIISGSLHILKKRDEDEAKVQRAMSAIETATKRGAALTSQLLTFARRQSVNPQAIRLGDRIEAIREVLHAGVGSAVRLAFDIDREVWSVKADVSELETGLLNLVINARDAMPDGGTVTVGARNVVLDDPLHRGEFVAITVADTGLGIPSDVVNKIFEPFFTTKPVGKGTGLGLSQVHGFAHQAGGTVKVASELGKGTTFTILLPRESATAPIDIPEPVPVPGSGTVLLVEDNPDVAIVSIGLLEQLGYRVHRVADAESALRELEKNGVDFVFTDIVMPGKMDGLGLAHHLRQIHPGLPILLATGYSEAAADVRGDFPILRKPYEIHELSEAIAKLPR